MKKIDGTLYSPIDDEIGDRVKMYVETVPEAVIMEDGSTLQDKIDGRENGVVISNTKPSAQCLWVNPDGIEVDEYFDFSDVGVTVDKDDTPVYKLRTPADEDGNRTNVYPLTSTGAVYVNENVTLDDIFNNYNMGFSFGREKPEHESVWGNKLFETVTVDDFGVEEEVVVLNEFLTDTAMIDGNIVTEDDYIFEYDEDDEHYVIAFFDIYNGLVTLSDSVPNKQTFWIDDISHTYLDVVRIADFLTDLVTIDGYNYQAVNKVISYDDEDYGFMEPDKSEKSDEQPSVIDDTMWIDTSEEDMSRVHINLGD